MSTSNNNNKNHTGVMAAKLEAVQPNHLEWTERNKCQLTVQQEAAMKKERYQDTLVRLLSSDEAHDELQRFLILALECLAADRVYPPPAEVIGKKLCEQGDIDDAQKAIQTILASSAVFAKRTLLLGALFFSPSFVRQFCPPPSEFRTSPFLVNPELLARFVGKPDSKAPLRALVVDYLNGLSTAPEFNAECYRTWCSRLGARPWHNAAEWRHADANGIGRELNARLELESAEHDAKKGDKSARLLLDADTANYLLTDAPPDD